MAFTTVLNTSRLVGLYGRMTQRAKDAVTESATEMRDLASQLAPRDTGSLAASIYVATPDASDYSERASSAASLNPQANIVPEITSDQVISLGGPGGKGYIAVVGISVEHGVYNELGTRYMAARPFMLPAAEPERDRFIQTMSHVADV